MGVKFNVATCHFGIFTTSLRACCNGKINLGKHRNDDIEKKAQVIN